MVLTVKAIIMAHIGAEKMFRLEGKAAYKMERSKYFENRLTVINPEGKRYSLALDRPGKKGWCACPFHAENGICKHKIWASETSDREDLEMAEIDRRAADIEEYEKFGKYELEAF
jgi:hypothetical protein